MAIYLMKKFTAMTNQQMEKLFEGINYFVVAKNVSAILAED